MEVEAFDEGQMGQVEKCQHSEQQSRQVLVKDSESELVLLLHDLQAGAQLLQNLGQNEQVRNHESLESLSLKGWIGEMVVLPGEWIAGEQVGLYLFVAWGREHAVE